MNWSQIVEAMDADASVQECGPYKRPKKHNCLLSRSPYRFIRWRQTDGKTRASQARRHFGDVRDLPGWGLRVYSDNGPVFVLSHSNAVAVYKGVKPPTIITAMLSSCVTIEPVDRSRAPPWLPIQSCEMRGYEARRACLNDLRSADAPGRSGAKIATRHSPVFSTGGLKP